MLVVGKACEVLEKKEQKWVVEEGFEGFGLEDLGGVKDLTEMGKEKVRPWELVRGDTGA